MSGFPPNNNNKRELPHQKKRKAPEDKQISLQGKAPFAQSKLWRIQRDFYETHGIDVWKGKVPFYATSNPLIASKYARMAFSLIVDGINNRVINPRKPIYFFEWGGGNGKFAYHFLNEFILCCSKSAFSDISFKYVLTDLSHRNVEFWTKHEQLKHFVRQNVLDYAQYDIEEQKNLRLINTNEVVSEKSLHNPPIVFANYFLDSIPQDLFHFQRTRMEKGYLEIETNTTNLAKGLIVDLNKLKMDFSYLPAPLNSYPDNTLNDLLKFYKNKIQDSKVLIPSLATRGMRFFQKFYRKNKAFFFFSDKGYTHLNAMQNLPEPKFAYHGSFSLMTNFHALSFYCRNSDGDVMIPNDTDGLTTQIFALGQKFDKFYGTKVVFEYQTNGFSMQNFLSLKNFIIPKASSMSVQELMSLLKLSNWDAKVLLDIANALVRKFNDIPERLKNELKANLRHLERNHFFFPNNENPIFELARINYCVGDYAESVRLYKISMKHYGESIEILFNLGLSYYYVKKLKEAKECLEKLVARDPSDTEAKEWIERITREMSKK